MEDGGVWRVTYAVKTGAKRRRWLDGYLRVAACGARVVLLADDAASRARVADYPRDAGALRLAPDEEWDLDGHVVLLEAELTDDRPPPAAAPVAPRPLLAEAVRVPSRDAGAGGSDADARDPPRRRLLAPVRPRSVLPSSSSFSTSVSASTFYASSPAAMPPSTSTSTSTSTRKEEGEEVVDRRARLLALKNRVLGSGVHAVGAPSAAGARSEAGGRGRSVAFPTAAEAFAAAAAPPELPPRFANVMAYRDAFVRALYEWINLQLRAAAAQLYGAVLALREPARVPACPHGRMALRVVQKDGVNAGRPYFACADPACRQLHWADAAGGALEPFRQAAADQARPWTPQELRALRTAGARVSERSRLIDRAAYLRATGRADAAAALAAGRGSQPASADVFYFRLDWREHHSRYKRGDLWVFSTHPYFLADVRGSCVFAGFSRFHGPSSDHLELEVFSESSGASGARRLPAGATFYALHGPNVASVLQMVDSLRRLTVPRVPIVSALLPARPSDSLPPPQHPAALVVACLTRGDVDGIAQRLCDEHSLNSDQADAVRHCARWLRCLDDPPEPPGPPLALVHGAFGCGKSTFAVAVVRLFAEVNQRGGCGCRVLVAAGTNAAVDRVMLGLLDRGFEDFLRVGSRKHMARSLLRFAPQTSADTQRERTELQELLHEHPEDSAVIAAALRDVDSGATEERARRLATVPVVGTTCASCALPLFDGVRFPIVLLDETSQMVEPASLVPMERAGCDCALLIGDPQQLPPVLEGFPDAPGPDTLARTMYVRLAALGVPEFHLRTQYRCHPRIAAVANELFYGGALLDGVRADDRPPLAPGEPCLRFIDVADGQTTRQTGADRRTLANEREAAEVEGCVRRFLNAAVAPECIGVVCMYYGQVQLLAPRLPSGVQVSTVDAFQGSEKDVIVVSCVRAEGAAPGSGGGGNNNNSNNSGGFIDSRERVNVALTRARHHLVIVGSAGGLRQIPLWKRILAACGECDGDGHDEPAK